MEMTTASRPALSARQMTITGLATAVTCIIGPVAVPIPVSPVPLSLTMLALYLAAYVLGMKLGFISCLLYLLLGAVGLPVFSGFPAAWQYCPALPPVISSDFFSFPLSAASLSSAFQGKCGYTRPAWSAAPLCAISSVQPGWLCRWI